MIEKYLLIAAAFTFLFSLVFPINLKKEKVGTLLSYYAIALQLLLLVVRSYTAKHPPYTLSILIKIAISFFSSL